MEHSKPTRQRSGRRATLFAAVAVVGLYLLPIAGDPPAINPNELVRLELALALATWSTVDLGQPARHYGLSEDVARRDQRILADKAPGLSFAAVPMVWLAGPLLPRLADTDLPAYWPLRHLVTACLVALTTALLGFFITASIPVLRSTGGLPLAIIFALGTPLWTYGTIFFGHAPAAVLAAVAWVLLLRPLATDEPPSRSSAFVGGLAAGCAIATEYPVLLLILVVLATLLARRTPWRLLAIVGLGLTAGLLPALVYHQAAFGAPWLTGYAFKADPGFAEIHTTGVAGIAIPTVESLWGVLFGSARGLFYYSPLLLLAPAGLWMIHRRFGLRESAPLAAAGVVYLAFAAGFVDWQAGWCAAARHVIPLVPLLAIPVMAMLVWLGPHRWVWGIAATLLSLSATRCLLAIVVTPFLPPEFVHPLSQLVLPSIFDGALAPTIVGSATGIPELSVWIGALVVSLVLVTWALTQLMGRFAATIAVAVMLASIIQIAWYAWQPTAVDPRQEMMRAQILAGLGHREVAVSILSEVSPESGLD